MSTHAAYALEVCSTTGDHVLRISMYALILSCLGSTFAVAGRIPANITKATDTTMSQDRAAARRKVVSERGAETASDDIVPPSSARDVPQARRPRRAVSR